MSPSSKLIGDLRKSRNMRQREFADALGVDQSYVSAIEAGTKAIPSDMFLQNMIGALNLNPDEQLEFRRVVEISSRKFTLPIDASPKMYELWHEYHRSSLNLQTGQIDILLNVLRLISKPYQMVEISPRAADLNNMNRRK